MYFYVHFSMYLRHKYKMYVYVYVDDTCPIVEKGDSSKDPKGLQDLLLEPKKCGLMSAAALFTLGPIISLLSLTLQIFVQYLERGKPSLGARDTEHHMSPCLAHHLVGEAEIQTKKHKMFSVKNKSLCLALDEHRGRDS